MIIAGTTRPWGAAKAVAILATQRDRFVVVLAEDVEREVERVVTRLVAGRHPTAAAEVRESVAGWYQRVRLERWPAPSAEAVAVAAPRLLPALRHVNDLPLAVAAEQARLDWLISDNAEHWNDEVARRTGLAIVTAHGFLRRLWPA